MAPLIAGYCNSFNNFPLSMHNVTLNLVVLRSVDLARAVDFYTCIGLQFSREQHGVGPVHFAAELVGGAVFELYPIGDRMPTAGMRVGFRVPSVAATIAALADYPEAVLSPPWWDVRWGWRAIVADPDGHRVELVQLPLG
jgi:lactoylglutathione lyase